MEKTLLDYFNGDGLAAPVWQNKYQEEGEVTPDDMHRRMALEFAKVDWRYHYVKGSKMYNDKHHLLSTYGQQREDLTEESIYQLFRQFKQIIPQGSIMSQLGSKSIGSLSNCFVIGQPEDSYGGIFQKDQEMAQLMKRRGGVGIDVSKLRPAGAKTSNAAKTTTGAVSFMHRYSNTTREVAQNGRRGALMISIDINHPDVLDFIRIKRDLSQVTGANISVKLNDDFMRAVEADEEYILRFPSNAQLTNTYSLENIELNKLYKVDGEYFRYIKAREYWEEIIKSAHSVAEPGLMFWNTMTGYSPDGVYLQYKPVTTNPCSEIGMQADDACRLIANNLFSFVVNPFTSEAYFDFDKFYEVNYEAMRLSDNLIDLEIEHIDRILNKLQKDIYLDIQGGLTEVEARKMYDVEVSLWERIRKTAKSSRRTGLGFTALGDTLAALGYAYDSDDALKVVEHIMKFKMQSELDCSIDLAILRGPFEGWNKDTEFPVENRYELMEGANEFYQLILDEFPEQAIRMQKHGRRNVSWSTVAPTGTVSLMAQTTSGIEPLFQPYYMRRKKVNPTDENARVDFTDDNGDTWQEFPVLHQKFKDWLYLTLLKEGEEDSIKGTPENFANHQLDIISNEELEYYFKKSPWFGSTANEIDWIKRVRMQSIIQKYITHSISSTINLPKDVEESVVSEIYLESWRQGLKGITVYRDGSRSGVLVSNDDKKEVFQQYDSPKRPKELDADYYFATSKGKKYAVIVGLLEDKPYEVFAFEDPIEETHLKGQIIKVKKGIYKFISPNYTIDNLQLSSDSAEEKLLTRWISLSLRHGANPKFIVEQTEKSELEITAFAKVIARTLKKYIKNGESSTLKCDTEGCDGKVIFEEGCDKCLGCGSTKCG